MTQTLTSNVSLPRKGFAQYSASQAGSSPVPAPLPGVFGGTYDILELLPAFIYLLTREYTFHYVNTSFRREFGIPDQFTRCHSILRKCHEPCDPCPAMRVFADGRTRTWVWKDTVRGNVYEVSDIPLTTGDDTELVLGVGYNITRRWEEKRRSQRSVTPEKLVKVCCHCNKIRNRKGNWQNMVSYFTDEHQFSFSHCICPECMQQHYADIMRGAA